METLLRIAWTECSRSSGIGAQDHVDYACWGLTKHRFCSAGFVATLSSVKPTIGDIVKCTQRAAGATRRPFRLGIGADCRTNGASIDAKFLFRAHNSEASGYTHPRNYFRI